jgi:WD40 repeat-containing protein SMU1
MSIASSHQHIGENIHTVLPLHTPANTMIAISRRMSVHLSYTGVLIRTFTSDDGTAEDLVAAVVSPSNKWLYLVCHKGTLTCYDVSTGKEHKSIAQFGALSSSGSSAQFGLAHHPHKGILAAFSRDGAQKRGILTLWR